MNTSLNVLEIELIPTDSEIIIMAARTQFSNWMLFVVFTLSVAGGAPVSFADDVYSIGSSHSREPSYGPTMGFELEGIVKPKRIAFMHFGKDGAIDRVYVTEGDQVTTGQRLVSLVDTGPQASLRAAEILAAQTAEIEIAKILLDQKSKLLHRTETAISRNASTPFELEARQAEFDQAKSTYDQRLEQQERAKAERDIAAADLAAYSLTAPFDGMVVHIQAKPGSSIVPAQPIITIADLTELEVEMFVPLRLYSTIKVGGNYPLQAGTPVSKVLVGRAISVSPIVDSVSGTFRVVYQIDNSEGTLPAGFTVSLSESGNDEI